MNNVEFLIRHILSKGKQRSYQELIEESGCALWELLDAWNKLVREGEVSTDKINIIDWYRKSPELELAKNLKKMNQCRVVSVL